MHCDRWKQCTPGGQLHSPHEIKLPSRKTAAKNVIGDRFSRWLQQQRWAIALHLTHSCCSCDDNHQSGRPVGQQPPLSESTRRGRRSILLHFRVKCVQIGVYLRGVRATSQDGSESVWNHPLQESVGASVCMLTHTYRCVSASRRDLNSNIVLCCNVSLCHQKIIGRPLSRC